MTWSPLSCVRSRVRRRSAVHSASGPWERRYSSSRSRRRARRSAANGASSGAGSSGLSRPSPRMMARTPLTQPRQLSCATTMVISAITRPSAGDQADQVAARVLAAAIDEAQVVQQHQRPASTGAGRSAAARMPRRASGGIARRLVRGTIAVGAATGAAAAPVAAPITSCTPTCTAPPASASRGSARRSELDRRGAGQSGAGTGPCSAAGGRPRCTGRSRTAARPAPRGRTTVAGAPAGPTTMASATESDSALATSTPRLFRSRLNHRSVTWSSSGTASVGGHHQRDRSAAAGIATAGAASSGPWYAVEIASGQT